MRLNRRLITKLLFSVSLVFALALLSCGGGSSSSSGSKQNSPPEPTTVPLVKLSTDTFTNSSSQHATEVEPDTFAFGSTIVSAFQVGRIFDGGGADIGFATSTDAGATWHSGFLPGVTTFQGNGIYTAASDPAIAYDAAHGVWIICSLALANSDAVVVSRSSDGINWGNPITITTGAPDKNWIACDNTSTSPYFGHCYVEWDDPSAADLIEMSTSTDGGLTWGAALTTADQATGIGGQPLVQPNGTVVVPIEGVSNSMLSFTSTDGGTTWNASVTISTITDHVEAANLRSSPLPGAEIDASGKVYVVWSDCRFRTNCSSNDLVLSTSTDGITWTSPARIPIDATSSTVDHFIPGLAVDPATSGGLAHLTLAYYSYPVSNCTAPCQLDLGYVTSQDGGNTWSAPTALATGMSTASLPNTFAGIMVGDYISTSYVNGKPFAVFAVANVPSGSTFDEAMYTTPQALTARADAQYFSSKSERPVRNAKSDHGPRKFYDDDGKYPIPQQKTKKRSARK